MNVGTRVIRSPVILRELLCGDENPSSSQTYSVSPLSYARCPRAHPGGGYARGRATFLPGLAGAFGPLYLNGKAGRPDRDEQAESRLASPRRESNVLHSIF